MLNRLSLTLLLGALQLGAVHAQTAADKPSGAGKSGNASRQELRSRAINMAAGIEAAEAALTPAQLAIAERVHTGRLPCELGQTVTLSTDPVQPGYFKLQLRQQNFRVFPVETSTGAVRLEDPKAGIVWLQLLNKSMLMNQKQGQRMADECMSPPQMLAAEELKRRPMPGLLDHPAPTVAADKSIPVAERP
jgi:hypothetical protein